VVVYAPELARQGTAYVVAARVASECRTGSLPDRLWFSLDQEEGASLGGTSEGFVAALLPLAMALGEELRVLSELDGRFVFGMEEYQCLLLAWYPRRLSRVPLRCDIRPPRSERPRGFAGTAFSGGVDSMHTLWSHLGSHEPVPAYRITHALFVHGFNIPLSDERSYREAADAYEPFLQASGVRLLRMRTNAREFASPPGWETAHGGALLGSALQLQEILGRFYVPSSRSYGTLEPWGSHPLLDPLLSTDALQVIHDGSDRTRVDKLAEIAEWGPTHALLRTCYARVDGLRNCCRCDNCVRTMSIIETVGSLASYTTFPLPLERRHVRRASVLTRHEKACARQLIAMARHSGRYAFCFDQG
jgi:hypothetical protein